MVSFFQKATSLTAIELTYIWPILSTILSPSQTPSPSNHRPSDFTSAPTRISLPSPSASSIYTSLTNILISLIRQRRDILSNHLPNFTRILCILMTSLRSLVTKTPMGAKTREAARVGLPWWVSLGEGEGGDPGLCLDETDGKALGRVLTTLTAKTVGRDGGGWWGKRGRDRADHDKKSESLAPSKPSDKTISAL